MEKIVCSNHHKDFCDCVKQLIKNEKQFDRDKGRAVFFGKLKKYGMQIINEYNNIICFNYLNNTYYFTERTMKYRVKDSKKWKSFKLFPFTDRDDSVPCLKFGKYRGYSIDIVFKEDKKYLQWLLTLDTIDTDTIGHIKSKFNTTI